MVEVSTTHSQFLDRVREFSGIDNSITGETRSKEMQRAVFGDARKVTTEECEELTNAVRDIREWLAENGDHHDESPDITVHSRTGLADFIWVKMKKSHDQSQKNREPYQKFGFELREDDEFTSFALNADNTYNLNVIVLGGETPFRISQLNGMEMTKPEHDFVMGCIGTIASHFRITLR